MTLRELLLMATARQKNEWDHTAATLAMIHNIMSSKPATVESFHPHLAKSARQHEKKPDLKALKWMFPQNEP